MMGRRKRGQVDGLSPSETHDRMAPFVAPVAAHSGAVIHHADEFAVARSVVRAFGEGVPEGGLTRAEICERLDGAVSPELLELRLSVYEGLGMLLPIVDKAHQARYILNPASLAGMMALERLMDAGGVMELLNLLDSTIEKLRAGVASQELVAAALDETRLFFGLLANALARIVASGSLTELLREAHHLDSIDCLMTLATLTELVRDQFLQLEPAAYAATTEAQRYNRAVEGAAGRILDQAARAGDFSVLPAEDYIALAYTGDIAVLADVCADLVFDPPAVPLDIADLAQALDAYAGPRSPRGAPPEPAEQSGRDPIGEAIAAETEDAARRARALEGLLEGAEAAEITVQIRSMHWPAAARRVADLMAADVDPASPVGVRFGELALVDVDMPVTYAHPLHLRRRSSPATEVRDPVATDVSA